MSLTEKDIHNWFIEIGLVDGLKKMKALEPFVIPLIKEWKEQARKELIEKLCGDLSVKENVSGHINAKIINEVLGGKE